MLSKTGSCEDHSCLSSLIDDSADYQEILMILKEFDSEFDSEGQEKFKKNLSNENVLRTNFLRNYDKIHLKLITSCISFV